MTTYLLSFVLCSGLLLAVYYVLLKSKAMYRFNRAYLLMSIMFSLAVPLIHLNNNATALKSELPFTEQLVPVQVITASVMAANKINNQPETFNYTYYGFLLGYSLITIVLLARFMRNLYLIRQMTMKNEVVYGQDVHLVLIQQRLTPHSFFNSIFVNKDDYASSRIDAMVLSHEMAHVRQKHSVDIVMIELIQAFLWFNPFIILYRKTILLNHEFLADEAALNTCPDVIGYQRLLLTMVAANSGLSMASQFNYSITKNRLMMMTCKTPVLTKWMSKLVVLPVAMLAVVLFSSAVEVTTQPSNPLTSQRSNMQRTTFVSHGDSMRPIFWPEMSMVPYPHTKDGISKTQMDQYQTIVNQYEPPVGASPQTGFKMVRKKMTSTDREQLIKIFKQMSLNQQRSQRIAFIYPSNPSPTITPSERDLNLWKNKMLYGVWLDDKHISNNELNNYKPGDIGAVLISRLSPSAIHYKDYKYQVNLMTKEVYNAYYKKAIANKYKDMMVTRMFRQPSTKAVGK